MADSKTETGTIQIILDHLIMPEIKKVWKTIDGNMLDGCRSNRKHFYWPNMGQLEEQNKRVLDCNSKYKIESIYIYTDKAKWLNKLRNQGEETNLSCREIPNNLHGYSALKELDCVDSLCIVQWFTEDCKMTSFQRLQYGNCGGRVRV